MSTKNHRLLLDGFEIDLPSDTFEATFYNVDTGKSTTKPDFKLDDLLHYLQMDEQIVDWDSDTVTVDSETRVYDHEGQYTADRNGHIDIEYSYFMTMLLTERMVQGFVNHSQEIKDASHTKKVLSSVFEGFGHVYANAN